jgi:thiol-disulfide isomerase/thioredoxin
MGMSFSAAALTLSWLAIALLALAMAGLLRQVREIGASLQGGGLRTDALGDDFVPEIDDLVPPGKDAVVLFVDSDCEGCREVLPTLGKIASSTSADLGFAAIFAGQQQDVEIPGPVAVRTGGGSLFGRLKIPLTPFAVVVDDQRKIVQAAPIGSPELLEVFVASAEGRSRDAANA